MSEAETPDAPASPPAKRPRSWLRRALFTLAGLALLLLSLPIGAWFLLPRLDLAGLAAARASTLLGREVAIESLRVTPGWRIRFALEGLTLANLDGGSRPDMLRVEAASAELDLFELLQGAPILRDTRIEGAALVLERDSRRRGNWQLGPGDAAPDRASLPAFDAIRLARAEILFRTSGGASLPTRIESASLVAEGLHGPVMLRAEGQVQGVALTLEGPLDSIATFRDAGTPFSLDLTASAEGTSLAFIGSARDPLRLDGLQGQMELRVTEPRALLALAGLGTEGVPLLPVTLAGTFDRQGAAWRLGAAYGELDGMAFTARALQWNEGAPGEPDAVTLDLALARLDLNQILRATGQEEGATDLPLATLGRDAPRITLRLAAEELLYAGLEARQARLAATLRPEATSLDSLALQAFGARITAQGQLENTGEARQLTAEVSLAEAELDTLGRALGLADIPLTGRLEGRFTLSGRGQSLNEVAREMNLLGVLAMPGGSIAREVMDRPANDPRPLQRASRGRTRLSCALAVLEMQAGVGEMAPLRLRAPTALVSGQASFDLNRQRLDLLFASHRAGTGNITLEAPIRVSGSFADPDVVLAQWSATGRARLSAPDTTVPLPAPLRDFARRSPCYITPGR